MWPVRRVARLSCDSLAPVSYDANLDLVDRWPGWRIRFARQDAAFVIFPEVCVIVITDRVDRAQSQIATAVAVAHLDLGHHALDKGALTEQQEKDAYGLACLRLDLMTSETLFELQ